MITWKIDGGYAASVRGALIIAPSRTEVFTLAAEWANAYDGRLQPPTSQRENLEEYARLLDELAATFRAMAGI
jgi:hypothetical protein